MNKKIAFIAFSDIHIEDWKKHSHNSSRLDHYGIILGKLEKLALKYKVPLLFTGDFYDNPKSLSNRVLKRSFKWLKSLEDSGVKLLCIHGNHDQSEKNLVDRESDNYLSTLQYAFNNIVKLNTKTPYIYKKYAIYGINFLSDNRGFEKEVNRVKKRISLLPTDKRSILLIHSDLPGAIDTSGREVNSSNLNFRIGKLFKGIDLILCGHIHKPQIIRKNLIMLGATNHQRISDEGNRMGYWLIYEDLSYKFIELKMPEFKYLSHNEDPPDNFNFYIKEQKLEDPKKDMRGGYNFNTNNPIKLTKAYLSTKSIRSSSKRRILINYLSL